MSNEIMGLVYFINEDEQGDSITIAFNQEGIIMEILRWPNSQILDMQDYIIDNEPDEEYSFNFSELFDLMILALSDAYSYDLRDITNPTDPIDPFEGNSEDPLYD